LRTSPDNDHQISEPTSPERNARPAPCRSEVPLGLFDTPSQEQTSGRSREARDKGVHPTSSDESHEGSVVGDQSISEHQVAIGEGSLNIKNRGGCSVPGSPETGAGADAAIHDDDVEVSTGPSPSNLPNVVSDGEGLEDSTTTEMTGAPPSQSESCRIGFTSDIVQETPFILGDLQRSEDPDANKQNQLQPIVQDSDPSISMFADTASAEERRNHAAPSSRASAPSDIEFQANSIDKEHDATQTSQNVGEIAETRHGSVSRSEVDSEEHLRDKHIVFIDLTGEDDVHIKVEPDSSSRKRRQLPDARPRKSRRTGTDKHMTPGINFNITSIKVRTRRGRRNTNLEAVDWYQRKKCWFSRAIREPVEGEVLGTLLRKNKIESIEGRTSLSLPPMWLYRDGDVFEGNDITEKTLRVDAKQVERAVRESIHEVLGVWVDT
jgi:hypothetical protein